MCSWACKGKSLLRFNPLKLPKVVFSFLSGLEGQVFSFGFVNLKNVTDSNLYNFTDFLIRVFTMIKDHCKLPARDCKS